MSIVKKALATMGIGAATVDTVLDKTSYQAGERINGVVYIKGGKVEQFVDAIYLALHTSFIKVSDDRKYTNTATIVQERLNEPFTIKEGEKIELPFTIVIPHDAPLTISNTRVWVTTGMDIKNAVDPTDLDYIEVQPNSLTNAILTSIESLGFRLREVECEAASNAYGQRYPFLQEFEFVPTSGEFRGKLDELELTFLNQNETNAEILFQVDRSARGLRGLLSEALEMDESFIRMTITEHDRLVLGEKIGTLIRRFI
ncbi:sporulation protein SpoOM [Bacillus coahuilensis m2-6]|uniref:sporulation protein n=1 Tax=Bacillus coahuilensis TaxID=408580 RepID=UPI0001850C37|nr:sporulation protein [Bacillus coahuilensis]KUP08191.1 sporulation protein SpoOM [Bacillus coahuilensis m2-6]